MTLPLSPGAAHAVHLLFEWTAIAIGMQLYRRQRARSGAGGILSGSGYAVVIGCILGAAIGNKLVFWIEYPHLWAAHAGAISVWMSGTSIVGGLLGGLLGVEIAKKLTGQDQSTGDQFVLPLVVGIAVGRIGCFLAGLNDGTYGKATALPWGVDFGDGVARHPTQLYDILFVLAWGGLLLALRARWRDKPGLMFKLFLSGYLAWRLAVDAIKPLRYDYGAGLGGVQLVCLAALLCYLPLLARQLGAPAPLKAIEP
ncbi:prolipoprotein diacylglyceryl transferase [Massilia violaceinigra]|uniref:Prolipoprotein diacylglyceryl transferase n=1 Tax=Massilia violaceinigra TaxID=2045208 RepID=A0ABY4AHK6_9BURK|nr:prolipoprotein diacylglyceryl transferase family protein [Massilia violaceinigra]UOD33119.1 prolipoprotein diacylglyceryl transferase [Massilia violaceinigra]